MPELPEVDYARQQLLRWTDSALIRQTLAPPSRTFRYGGRTRFLRLRGRVTAVERRGKYLLMQVGREDGVLLHLGMSGRFVRRPRGMEVRHSRAAWTIASRVIHLVDPRGFGFVCCAPARVLRTRPPWTALGYDALDPWWTPDTFHAVLQRSQKPVKAALLDQRLIAGLGNIYAAEALYEACIAPTIPALTLNRERAARLLAGVKKALARGARSLMGADEATYLSQDGANNPFRIYARAGQRCVRCRSIVRATVIHSRTTYYCPTCQSR